MGAVAAVFQKRVHVLLFGASVAIISLVTEFATKQVHLFFLVGENNVAIVNELDGLWGRLLSGFWNTVRRMRVFSEVRAGCSRGINGCNTEDSVGDSSASRETQCANVP